MTHQVLERDRVLYHAFQDIDSYLDDLYDVYRGTYTDVAHLEQEITLTDPHAFEYCCRRKYFILVIPYTSTGEMLLEATLANDEIGWAFVGGGLRTDLMETFTDATNRIASLTLPNLELGEIEPIAFLTNRFVFRGELHDHFGIVFVGRIRNQDPIEYVRKTAQSHGHLVPFNDEEITISNKPQSGAVLHIARQYFTDLFAMADVLPPAEFEIQENKKYRARYVIHNAIVKPAFRTLGRLFPDSVEDLEARMQHILQQGPHQCILDVACGDNPSVINYSRLPEVELVVANDVAWSQIALMKQRFTKQQFRGSNSFTLFTNHDARRMPFADSHFDFVLCKNVFHHMDSLRSARKLLDEIIRTGKRALVVEVLDPNYEGPWDKVRDRYYTRFLHDAGMYLLSREEFAQITSRAERRETFEMRTIRGTMQFALFEKG